MVLTAHQGPVPAMAASWFPGSLASSLLAWPEEDDDDEDDAGCWDGREEEAADGKFLSHAQRDFSTGAGKSRDSDYVKSQMVLWQ